MTEEKDRREGQGAARTKDSRQDRLKLALRENLKRRKSQARERGKIPNAPSNTGEDTPHDETGKRGM